MRFGGEKMRKITIQQPAESRTASGQVQTTWEDIPNDPNPWSHIRDKRGRESFEAEKKTVDMLRVFQIYRRTDVNEQCTIVDQGKRFDIRAIYEVSGAKMDIEAEWTEGQYEN